MLQKKLDLQLETIKEEEKRVTKLKEEEEAKLKEMATNIASREEQLKKLN